MADAGSGVSADSLRGKLIEQLEAQHVEVEDLSGMNDTADPFCFLFLSLFFLF